MTYQNIQCYNLINSVDADRVSEIKKSLLANGWQGMPILVAKGYETLVTGSHRLAALKSIEKDMQDGVIGWEAFDYDVVQIEDVSALLDDYFEENPDESEIEFDNLSRHFEGTWIEQYKDELIEW